jgi:L-2,4-diaminobutyrate decarboxylase
MDMHDPTAEDRAAARETLEWALGRLADRRATLPPLSPEPALPALTERGVGPAAALRQLREDIFPTAIPTDHPRYLAFIPGSPTVIAVVADMALSAAGVYGGTRLEAGAAVAAEDAVLRWLADAAGLPATAGGTFVSGGSIANLSALVAARADDDAALRRHVVVGASAHASLAAAAQIMACELTTAQAADEHGRLDGRVLTAALAGREAHEVVAVVATAGATNNGAVDDIASVADVCDERGLWLHVDAAYGGGALLSPRTRHLFAGIERADSLTIDPHKWLFTPFDCAAVIYRETGAARRALTQQADYLDAVSDETGASPNPSDLAVHLTRRARGLPLWASLLAYGTSAYVEAVDACLDLAGSAARMIQAASHLELAAEPALSVVLFHRRGWGASDYAAWSEEAIHSGSAVAIPTRHLGRPALRLCFVNPLTTVDDIALVLASLA